MGERALDGRWAGRAALLTACAALAAAATACAPRTEFVRGARIGTETRTLSAEPVYRIEFTDRLDAEPPVVELRLRTALRVVDESRGVYEKVLAHTRRPLAFQPEFFLWPVNVVRPPVGLAGCALSALGLGGHYAAGALGVGVGFFTTSRFMPWAYLFAWLGLVEVGPQDKLQTAGIFTQIAVWVFETLLLPLDLPHRQIHGTPLYPVLRNREEFPGDWLRGIRDSWRFAWGFRAYPPFFIWPAERQQRHVVYGDQLTGEWEQSESVGEWGPGQAGEFVLEGEGWRETVGVVRGRAVVNLRRLAHGLPDDAVLKFTATAQTPEGSVTRTLRYRLSDLRRAP